MTVDPLFSLTAQYFLALLLLAHGGHKLMGFSSFSGLVQAYQLLPVRMIAAIAVMLIISEIFLGVGLLVFPANMLVTYGAMLLFFLYCCVMALSIANGKTYIDCGCSFLSKKSPLSPWHLIRNAVLIGLAALTLLSRSQRELLWVDIFQIAMGVVCLSLIYLSADALLSNRSYLLEDA